MACKTAKCRHILQTAKHRRHIFAFSLKFIMRLAYTHMQIANTKNNHSSLHDLCKPAKPVIITRSFANQPSQSSSQDLCKPATYRHQKEPINNKCQQHSRGEQAARRADSIVVASKTKDHKDSIVVAIKAKDRCSITCCDLNSWQANRHRSV